MKLTPNQGIKFGHEWKSQGVKGSSFAGRSAVGYVLKMVGWTKSFLKDPGGTPKTCSGVASGLNPFLFVCLFVCFCSGSCSADPRNSTI